MRIATLQRAALQFYRFAALALIVWLIRDHHIRQRNFGDRPVAVSELTSVFTNATSLRLDHSERAGLFVLDAEGNQLGYIVRTLPECNHIIGYCGITDLLILFDPSLRVLGWKVRSTEDTRSHMQDIVTDRKFPMKWNGMTWEQVAEMDLKRAGIEGVSGATMTSMAMAQSIVHRLKSANERALHAGPLRFAARDWALAGAIVCGALLTFTRLHHGRPWLRRAFQLVLIGYIGLINGDLIAQSLLAGWAGSGVPWKLAPGVVLLVAAAFLMPWTTGKPLYCQQLCPHGAAQEWLGRTRWKNSMHLPAPLAAGLRWMPALTLVFVLLVVMLDAPFDLAGIEPFDAYILRSAGAATLAVAVVGLIASVFIPQAYCRYGCPTGALLEFIRHRGASDRWSRRDSAALLLVLLAMILWWQFQSGWGSGTAVPAVMAGVPPVRTVSFSKPASRRNLAGQTPSGTGGTPAPLLHPTLRSGVRVQTALPPP